jgi:predicted ATPase/DNA-binding CsgD family transcriptional regulator
MSGRPQEDNPKVYRLPALPSSLIGREQELKSATALLDQGIRLLTLTGPPGVGKTRLALAVGAQIEDRFELGAVFVNLAPVRDPDLFEHVLIQALGIQRWKHFQPGERIARHLSQRSILLVLDNFEQITAAAPRLATLLASCPGAAVATTSREPLRLSGEREFPVQPLRCPDVTAGLQLDELAAIPAVRLFVERAKAIMPAFTLTKENARAVAEICVRLEGLPLAIELAAARIRALTPQSIVDRLGQRLDFLVSGSRDIPERQRTLRAAIVWSYDLLEVPERRLLSRLAVFAGGFALDAARAVAARGEDCLEAVSSLLAKSLLWQHEVDGEPRYEMLETIREYASEQLAVAGELDEIRDQHLEYFNRWARDTEPESEAKDHVAWVARVDREYENLKAALAWAVERSTMDRATRLAVLLCAYWNGRGNVGEGYRWLETVATRSEDVPLPARAEVVVHTAALARFKGDREHAAMFANESVELARQSGDRKMMARTLIELGHATDPFHHPLEARRSYEEALGLAAATQHPWYMGIAIQGLAIAACGERDFVRAARLFGAAEVVFEGVGESYAPNSVAEQTIMGRSLVAVLTGLGREAFGRAWAEGRGMRESLAVEYALGRTQLSEPKAPRGRDDDGAARSPLTRREHEIADLVAQGLSNREIAAALVISERTVDAHVQHILNKLGFHSRAQVAAWIAVSNQSAPAKP